MFGKTLIFDLRSLQDSNYRHRGIGRLGANLILSARRVLSGSERLRMVGIVDRSLPDLDPVISQQMDLVQPNGYLAQQEQPSAFIQLSPMTHDPLAVGRIVSSQHIFKAAIVHDFIPLQFPERYIPSLPAKIDFRTKMYWLSRYDHFFPNSDHTASEITRFLGIPTSRITHTAAPIDPAFLKSQPRLGPHLSGHVLVAGGADGRKNVECAIRAYAQSAIGRMPRAAPLLITGSYPEDWKRSLLQLYSQCGGPAGHMHFLNHVTDDELASTYQNALCLVVPSRTEGFSIPVVEGMASHIPVFASAIPAHRELLQNESFMFAPDDHAGLASLLDCASNIAFRNMVIDDQKDLWQSFKADIIAESFWRSIDECTIRRMPAPMIGGRRPKIAFLGPLPPDRSGVADYTAATFKSLSAHAEIHVFTSTQHPVGAAGAASISQISALPYLGCKFDRIIGVMGNSHFHIEVFDLLMKYGGACIQHDNRLLGFYRVLLGEKRALEAAEKELGRPVPVDELNRWLGNEALLEATFLGELAKQADPLFVHSKVTAQLVRDRFNVSPTYLPFAIYRGWDEEHLVKSSRKAARLRLGIPANEILVATFGNIGSAKGPEECVWAVSLLRGWGIPATMHFVGEPAGDMSGLLALRDSLGLKDHVHFGSDFVSETTYRDFLLAADIAVQLRTHGFGGLSGALLDCIAVGLPTVVTQDMKQAMDAPGYVSSVPDRLSPVLVAEALANQIESKTDLASYAEQRHAYCREHSFGVYAERMMSALALDFPRSALAS